TIYGAVTHKITAKLIGSVLGQYQNSQFNGGGAGISGVGENFFLANLNLAYKINPYLLTEAGYEYNRLDSEFGRAYTRNRVYLGVRATY
ncbi:MAG: outer membrane beta-barrel protein, partial [Limisphaerales bacterium]